jgi:hypothetical protein
MWFKFMCFVIPKTAASGLKCTGIYPDKMMLSQKRNFSKLRLRQANITGPIQSSPKQPTAK